MPSLTGNPRLGLVCVFWWGAACLGLRAFINVTAGAVLDHNTWAALPTRLVDTPSTEKPRPL